MESQVIEKISKPIQEISLPKLETTYPMSRVHGRVISTKVVGVTFEGRQEVVARLQMGDVIWLEHETDNPYDQNAIKVCRSNGEQIGYLSRQLAARIVPYFKACGHPVRGKVRLLTGNSWDGYTLGVVIIFKLPKIHQSKKVNHNHLFDDWHEEGEDYE